MQHTPTAEVVAACDDRLQAPWSADQTPRMAVRWPARRMEVTRSKNLPLVFSLELMVTCMQTSVHHRCAKETLAADLVLDVILDRVRQEVLQLEEDL